MSIRLLSRADDFGSARAANRAILEAVRTGAVIRNVSCMAVGPYIAEGAEALRDCEGAALGIHAVLNSEWDTVKWGPLTEGIRRAGLTDGNGYFLQTQRELAERKPDIEVLLGEYDAQLERLTRLGLKIEYVDSHMGPELLIPGMGQAIRQWSERKGLIDAAEYYRMAEPAGPQYGRDTEEYLENTEKWLDTLEEGGQYFYITHPALGGEETLRFCNGRIPAGTVQKERSQEYAAVTSGRWNEWMTRRGIRPVRYTEAEKQQGSEESLRKILGL